MKVKLNSRERKISVILNIMQLLFTCASSQQLLCITIIIRTPKTMVFHFVFFFFSRQFLQVKQIMENMHYISAFQYHSKTSLRTLSYYQLIYYG